MPIINISIGLKKLNGFLFISEKPSDNTEKPKKKLNPITKNLLILSLKRYIALKKKEVIIKEIGVKRKMKKRPM